MAGLIASLKNAAVGIKNLFLPPSKSVVVPQPPYTAAVPEAGFWNRLKNFIPHFTRTPPLLEQIRAATVSGYLNLLPYFDQYTEETPEMRRQYRVMLRDPTIKSGLFDKVFSVAALDLQLEPASENPRDEMIADFVRDCLVKILDGGIRKIVESLAFPALVDGHSVSEPVRFIEDHGQWKGKTVLRALKSKDSEHLQLMGDEFRNVVAIRANTYNGGRLFDPADFVLFTHFSLFESPAGMSDLRACYRAYWLMDTAWKLRGIHLDKFSNPFLIGKYKDVKNKPALDTVLAQVRSENYISIPDTSIVDAVNLSQRGTSDFEAAIKDLREEILLSIVGAYLQAITSEGGSGQRGSSAIHKGTTEIVKWHLSQCIADALNRRQGGIIPDLVDRNFANADYPFAKLGGLNDTDLAASLLIDQGLIGMGVPLSRKDVYRRYGRQKPVDLADTLLSPPPPPQPGFGQPGQQQPPGGGLLTGGFRGQQQRPAIAG